MLARLRQQKYHFLRGYLIIFTLLVKMILSLAHASNINPANNTSFLSSLCAGGFVTITIESDDQTQSSNITLNVNCPLCLNTEQDIDTAEINAVVSVNRQVNLNVIPFINGLVNTSPKTLHPIRAPPTFS